MLSFKDFIIEKKVENKSALYIACPFDEEQVKELYKNFPRKDMMEPELDPHMTLFYSPMASGYDKEEILKYLKEALADKKFEGNLTKYKVFHGVDEGRSDCLVVEVNVDKELKELRRQVVDKIKKSVENLEITYPTWKPHMTIGYYEVDKVPKHEKFEPVEITLENFFCKFGDSESKEYKL